MSASAREKAFAIFDESSEDEDGDSSSSECADTSEVEEEGETVAERNVAKGKKCVTPSWKGDSLPLWVKHFPPHVLGPVQFGTSVVVGGQREFVAPCDVPAGTLLMSEEPFHVRSSSSAEIDDLLGATNIVREAGSLMKGGDFKSISETPIMICAKLLHPVALSDVGDETLVSSVRMSYDEDIRRVSAENGMREEEFLRLIFVVRCNCFESGLFLHQSIFNHSCRPNCIKFRPTASNPRSEVWTTRRVSAGEPFTICYLHPQEQTFSLRQQRLHQQFLFDCRCERCTDASKKKGRDELERSALTDVEFDLEVCETSGELAILDTIVRSLRDAKSGMADDRELLLMRALRNRVDIRGRALLSTRRRVSRSVLNETCALFLKDAMELQRFQIKHLGSVHPAVGRTAFDVHSAIGALLANDRKALKQFFESKESAQEEMQLSKKKHALIKHMY
eukprot:g176.t1